MWSRVKGRKVNSWRGTLFFSPLLLCAAKSHMLCSSASDKSVAPNLTRFSGCGSSKAAARQHPCQLQTRLACQLYFGILFYLFIYFFFTASFLPSLIPLVKVIQCSTVSSTLIACAVVLIPKLGFIFTLPFLKSRSALNQLIFYFIILREWLQIERHYSGAG